MHNRSVKSLLLSPPEFSPRSIPREFLPLYLDFTDIASMTNDGSFVISQVNDKSGNNNHATATGTARPTYTTNGLNGKPSLVCNGSNFLTLTNPITLSADYSIFCVFNVAQSAITVNADIRHIANGTTSIFGFQGSTTPDNVAYRGSNSATFVTSGLTWTAGANATIHEYRRNASNQLVIAQDNNTSGVLQTATGNLTIGHILGRTDGFRLVGNFAEIVILNRIATDRERNGLINYFRRKYII